MHVRQWHAAGVRGDGRRRIAAVRQWTELCTMALVECRQVSWHRLWLFSCSLVCGRHVIVPWQFRVR